MTTQSGRGDLAGQSNPPAAPATPPSDSLRTGYAAIPKSLPIEDDELSKLSHADLRTRVQQDLKILRDARTDLAAGEVTPQIVANVRQNAIASIGERARRHQGSYFLRLLVARDSRDVAHSHRTMQQIGASPFPVPGESAVDTAARQFHQRAMDRLNQHLQTLAERTQPGSRTPFTRAEALNKIRERLKLKSRTPINE